MQVRVKLRSEIAYLQDCIFSADDGGVSGMQADGKRVR
jgi:hypothetical protein